MRILQRERLGAERGPPVDTGRSAHRAPPRGAQGGEPRAGSRGGRLQRLLWKAFLFRCPVWGGRNPAWGNSKPKRESKESRLRWLLLGQGGPLGGQCLPQEEPRDPAGTPRPGSERGLRTTAGAARVARGWRFGPEPRAAGGRGARALSRGARPRGREIARRPGPTPTHLRAPIPRHVRKRRRSVLRRRAPAPPPALPGRSRRPGGLASRWLRRSRSGSWRETPGGGGGASTASARLLVHLWNGRAVTGVSGFDGGLRSHGQGWA